MVNNFGSRLKNLRLMRGLTVSEISKQIGVSQSTYRDWEYGRKISGHQAFVNIANALRVSLDELMSVETTAPQREEEILRTIELIEKLANKNKLMLKSFFENETQTQALQKQCAESLFMRLQEEN